MFPANTFPVNKKSGMMIRMSTGLTGGSAMATITPAQMKW